LALVALFFTASVSAQQAPGAFDSGSPPYSGSGSTKDPVGQEPGEHRQAPRRRPIDDERGGSPGSVSPDGESETLRLKALVESQQEKISLLEAKIKLLEAELQKQKGVNR
jgi:hypothetical protein